jgi:hypothetical protein
MSKDVYTVAEVLKLAGITRRQLDNMRARLGPILRPTRIGCMLLFDPADVRTIMAARAAASKAVKETA